MSMSALLERREILKYELEQVESALGVLKCSYCQQWMDLTSGPLNTFTDGLEYAAVTTTWDYACSRCGQAVVITQWTIREMTPGGKWKEIGPEIETQVRNMGKPFIAARIPAGDQP